MNDWLGLDRTPAELTFAHMALRTAIVFGYGIVLLRVGARRSLGRNAGYDILMSIVLGSVLSRAINGQASFFPTLGAGAVLVALHEILSWCACRSDRVSRWVKGQPIPLVRDGTVDRAALRRSNMSQDDLEENLRNNGNVARPAEVQEARLERNGEVSVVPKDE